MPPPEGETRLGREALVRRWGLGAQLWFFLVLLAVGVLLAFAWRLLAPSAAGLGEDEPAATVDGTLALLGIPFGVLTAGFVLLRPGSAPVRRTLTAILGSLLGSMIAWQVGDHLGTPALRAVGAAFSWPVTTATAIFFGALLPWTSGRLQTTPPSPPDGLPPVPLYYPGHPPAGYPAAGDRPPAYPGPGYRPGQSEPLDPGAPRKPFAPPG